MQSNEKQTSLEKHGEKNNRSRRRTVLLIACAIILIAGGVLAKYITSNRQQAEMQSSQFHISSNYLEEEEGNASYTVADWGNGFDILLYNYEKENIAQISEVDMTYQVTAEHATVSVKDQNGNDVTENAAGDYPFHKETGTAYHVLHVAPGADVGKDTGISITVQTTSPYRKKLKAIFNTQNNSKPDYKITDQSDGTILITVKTNDYQDSMTVRWNPAKYSPDNTNVLMAAWKDENPTGSFKVDRNSTYELLFFKNTSDAYQTKESSGTEIELE